jgi:hypothetical protein
MSCHSDVVDFHPTRSTFGIHTPEPEVVLSRAVNQTLKTRRQVFDLSAHTFKGIGLVYQKVYLG